MPAPKPTVKPPQRIYWIMGGVAVFFGLLLFGCGYYLAHTGMANTLGLIMVTLGGIGFGIGARVLGSCYIGLRKSRR